MTVAELIAELKKLPPDMPVHIWDNHLPTTEVQNVAITNVFERDNSNTHGIVKSHRVKELEAVVLSSW